MNDEQLLRYSKHLLMPTVDFNGQSKLLNAKVMIVGLGGLGSPVALYLAAAGVGELILVDDDEVELSNLQRQVIHGTSSLGAFKVDSAYERIKDLNPDCKVVTIKQRFDDNDQAYHQKIDAIVDCTDSLDTRLCINNYCVKNNIPLISGAAIRMEGQVVVFLNNGQRQGACYQCLYSDINEVSQNCSEVGVLSTTVGIIGTIQAQQSLKLIMGIGTIEDGSMQLMDGMTGDWRKVQITKRPDCPCCSTMS